MKGVSDAFGAGHILFAMKIPRVRAAFAALSVAWLVGPARAQDVPAKPAAQPGEKAEGTPRVTTEPKALIGKPNDYFESLEPETIAEGMRFTEGPLWWEGRLLYCDLGGDAIYSIKPGPGAKPEEFRRPADRPAGLALDTSGRLLATHFGPRGGTGKVTRRAKDGTVETLIDKAGESPVKQCNDLAVRSDGTFYFTDFGGGKDGRSLFRVGTDAKAELVKAEFKAANGVCLSPDEKTLYVADMGDNKIKAFDVGADGALANERVFADFKGDGGGGSPDGMKTDVNGNLYTTGPGGIWVVSPKGDKLARLDQRGCSNLCFGGEDRRTMFITCGTKVLSVRTRHAGAPTPKPAK